MTNNQINKLADLLKKQLLNIWTLMTNYPRMIKINMINIS